MSTTDYATKFQAAGAELEALAERVTEQTERRAAVADRLGNARRDVARADAALAKHKATAVDKLAASTTAYERFQGRLRRLTRERESAADALALLESDTAARVERDLAAAKDALRSALKEVAAGVRADCEATIRRHFIEALDERDAFAAAGQDFFRGFGPARPPLKPARTPSLKVIERKRRTSRTAAPEGAGSADGAASEAAGSPNGGPADSEAVQADAAAQGDEGAAPAKSS